MTNQTTENPTAIGQTAETEATPKRARRLMRSHCKHCGAFEAEHGPDKDHSFEPRPRGFGAMSKEQRVEIASRGGVAAHKAGTAHKWTSDEARAAGHVGGNAPHVRRGPERGKHPKSSREPCSLDTRQHNHMITTTAEVAETK